MSLIPCASKCIYQKDGFCLLESPNSINNTDIKVNSCIYFIPENKQETKNKAQL